MHFQTKKGWLRDVRGVLRNMHERFAAVKERSKARLLTMQWGAASRARCNSRQQNMERGRKERTRYLVTMLKGKLKGF